MSKTKAINPESPMKKQSELSGHELVIDFMNKSDHPLKKVIEAVREIVLSANKEITEHIKWNAPSFCYKGEDRLTLNLHSKEYILIVFHRGAKVKDRKENKPFIKDTTGLLEWVANDRATVKLHSIQDVSAKKDILKKVVNQWITLSNG
jgi:uncharacterized protein YdeI (YjbR/CyaY-like superfamily)